MAESKTAEKPLFLRLPGGSFAHERDLWRHRALLRQLVKADLRGRYVATTMGFFWSVIHPLALLLVYIFVFSIVFRAKFGVSDNDVGGAFWIYFCSGMLPWMWLTEALSGAANSIVAQGGLLRKNRFPIIVLPMQPILSGLFHFVIAFGLFLIFRCVFHGVPGLKLLALPFVIALQFALLVSVAYLLATLNVFWRDVGQLLTSGLMIWLWLTPIFYRPEIFEAALTESLGAWSYKALLLFFLVNPITHLVGLYQQIFFFNGLPAWMIPTWGSVLYLVALSLVLWFIARRLFGRAQSRMVEMV